MHPFLCPRCLPFSPAFPEGINEDVLLSAPNYSLLEPCRAHWVLPVTPGFGIMQQCDGAANQKHITWDSLLHSFHKFIMEIKLLEINCEEVANTEQQFFYFFFSVLFCKCTPIIPIIPTAAHPECSSWSHNNLFFTQAL